MATLDVAALGELLESFEARLFRMEALPRYAVASDGDDYHRYVRGEADPDWDAKQPWLDVLLRDRELARRRMRVRLLTAEVTDYERYACEWGYAINADHGEDIRVLRRGEHHLPEGLIAQDFWVVDDHTAVGMRYDSDGAFLGAEVLPDTALVRLRAARDDAWATAEPFSQWWSRHDELHRGVVAPA